MNDELEQWIEEIKRIAESTFANLKYIRDDVISEASLALWQNWDTFAELPEREQFLYLCGVVRNKYLFLHRKEEKHNRRREGDINDYAEHAVAEMVPPIDIAEDFQQIDKELVDIVARAQTAKQLQHDLGCSYGLAMKIKNHFIETLKP